MRKGITSFLLLAGLGTGVLALPSAATGKTPLSIEVLSNRADLISGGDALLRLSEPAMVRVNDKDVSSAFATRQDGLVTGLVEGLELGTNMVVASAGRRTARLVITNHPSGGPVFSGPQIQPWVCQPTAINKQCDQPPSYSFLYKSTDPTKEGLQPYDPANPPGDVATTTTDQGVTVPFVVRRERGYLNRDRYLIMALFDPKQPWTASEPQKQWNRKVHIPGGGNCGNAHEVGSPPLGGPRTIAYEFALSRGFAVISHAMGNTGHACNPTVAAEALLMLKERLIEQYGQIRFTIGTGCSGGSLVQMWVANAYPGIYQGITPGCTYTDGYTTLIQFTDYHLLRKYFEAPQTWSPGVAWTTPQMEAVAGHTYANVVVGDTAFVLPIVDPSSACPGVSAEQRYDAATRPEGTRCGLLDYNVNALGVRPQSAWSENERKIQQGFAGSPFDSVGVQFGLQALQAGSITPEMFVDLNEKIGGLSIDFRKTPQRSQADITAIANAFRSGGANPTNNLDQTAIISMTGTEPGLAHDVSHAFWARYRLDREHGDHDNFVMWTGPVPLTGDVTYANSSFLAMDRWLTAVEQDKSSRSVADKISENKPSDVHDQCSDGAGQVVLDDVCPEPLLTNYSTPREVAGLAKTADVFKCQLKPLSRQDDYGVLGFSDEQWTRMEALFPTGICDATKPGVAQQGTIAWASYGTATTNLYGGEPLGKAPTSVPEPSADLSVSKSGPGSATVGQQISYTITAANGGPETATAVTVTDPLPEEVSFVSVSPAADCGEEAGTVTCSFDSLAPGADRTITVTVTVDEAGTFTNTATVDAAEGDPNAANNADSVTTTASPEPSADLAVTKEGPREVSVGATFTYMIVVTNGGPDTATEVAVTDEFPAEVAFLGVSPPQDCAGAGGTVVCAFDSLPSGDSRTIRISVRATQAGTFTNTATADADEEDPNAGNNAASATTTARAGASPSPSPDPTASPHPSPDPTASPHPSPDPTASPGPGPTPTPTPTPTDRVPSDDQAVRVAGDDRIETALAVSQAEFGDDQAGAVVLARADIFPDVLAGTPLAITQNAPLLLTAPDSLNPATEAELTRVLPPAGTVYLLGGEQALNAGIADRISALGFRTVRYGGENRFATAVVIADQGLGNPGTLLAASGNDFPDALAAGAAGGAAEAAVVLTAAEVLPPETRAYLDARPGTTRFAVGGPAAQAVPDATPLAGPTRFETVIAVAERFFTDPPVVGVATARRFPDALAGGAQVGRAGGPILLSEADALPQTIRDYLERNRQSIDGAFIYGGTEALLPAVLTAVDDAIQD